MAAVGANLTSLDAAFKQFYEGGIEDLTYTDRPFLALVPKEEGWVGANQATRGWHIPIKFALPPAVSSYFAKAQGMAATTSTKIQAWELTSKQMFGFIQIDNESIERSKGNEAAFVELKSEEINGIVQNVSNRLHHYCYGDGTGVIAQVGNSTQMPSLAVSKLYLLNPEDAVKFAYGDQFTVSGTATGAERALGSAGHGLIVIGTDYDLGTVTVGTPGGVACNLTDATDGIPTIANLDYIAHVGDRLNTSPTGVITGYQGYIPAYGTTITNTTLYNVDRSQNVDWLAGSRFDGSSMGIEEALMRSSNVVAKKGGKIEQFFLNHKHYSDLCSAIAARGQINFLEISPSEYPTIGFEGVKILGAKGEIDVIPDYACPSTMAAGARLSMWTMGSVGDLVANENGDGLQFLRLGTADGVEARFHSYSNLVPRSPRDNVNVLLPQ